MARLLSAKGAHLCDMQNSGFAVPSGFILSTEVHSLFIENSSQLPVFLKEEIAKNITTLEKTTGKQFGVAQNPLLISIRSGCFISMPGAMDTILNVGINDAIAENLATGCNTPYWAYDTYRRFIEMYAEIVKRHPTASYQKLLQKFQQQNNFNSGSSLEECQQMIQAFKKVYFTMEDEPFPEDPQQQLFDCIYAVLHSWDNPRAESFRKNNSIPYTYGTAVIIQDMVFGNRDENSGSGVVFSRDPATGKNILVGEYLLNAQGEDIVTGIGLPRPIQELQKQKPSLYAELAKITKQLELQYKDIQDIEFTFEQGTLYILQTRPSKRSPIAACNIAVDLVEEKLISKEQALLLVEADQLDGLITSQFKKKSLQQICFIEKGTPGSPGAISGHIVFTSTLQSSSHHNYTSTILVCDTLGLKNTASIFSVNGILSNTGGVANHTAILARNLSIPCIFGISSLRIDESKKQCTLNGKTFYEGDMLSFDGSTGEIYIGRMPVSHTPIPQSLKTILQWANEISSMKVYITANTPSEIKQGLCMGADGVGLCRTEHMFFEQNRLECMREFFLSTDLFTKKNAIRKIFPFQLHDFTDLFEQAGNKPLVIRFLDPFLQEFLPDSPEELQKTASNLGISISYLERITKSLLSLDPLLKSSGTRLGVFYPELVEMQTAAIIGAAIEVQERTGQKITPHLLFPKVGDVKELRHLKNFVTSVADMLIQDAKVDMNYKLGTMLALPRACILADTLAPEIDFFVFEPYYLTQLVFGFTEEESNDILDLYLENRIFNFNPFENLDYEGVGTIISSAIALGKNANPTLSMGASGKFCQNVSAIDFFYNANLNFITCPPFFIPNAKIAAAQAVIKKKFRKKNF